MPQVLLTGLASGAIYGIIALAYSSVYYVTRVINFATGQLLMSSIMVTAVLSMHRTSVWLAIIIGITTSTIGGVVVYFIAVRPVLRFSRFSFAWLVSTLGAGIILSSFAALFWGSGSLPFPILLNGHDVRVIAGAQLTWQQIMTVFVAIFLLVAFEIFRKRTLFGKLGMAISYDPEIASSIGANVTSYAILAFALGGLLVGVAGILVGPISFADAYMGDSYGIFGFVALMIGGIDKPAGAMGGGFILGILQSFAVTYINSQASDWFPFIVVVVVLLIAPNGIFMSGPSIKKRIKRLSQRKDLAKL